MRRDRGETVEGAFLRPVLVLVLVLQELRSSELERIN